MLCTKIIFLFFLQFLATHQSSKTVLIMAQMQLDMASHFPEEFGAVQCDGNQVTCQLNPRFSLIVKRCKQSIYILLRSGNKVIKLPFHIFDAICNSHVTVTYLKHFLEEAETEVECRAWLCCYCGARFVSEADCDQHEVGEHVAVSGDLVSSCQM